MIKRLGLADAPEIQRLFERCADFFVLTEGAPPADDAAVKELTWTDNTVCFGTFDGDRLIAFAQIVRDTRWPAARWWLGLLLLDPAERSRGLGPRIHGELVEWLTAQSCTTLWIGVMEQNVAAERFWRRLGYEEESRQPYAAQSTGFESTVIVMSMALRTTPSSPSD